MLHYVNMPPFTPVQAGKETILKLPLGKTYDKLRFKTNIPLDKIKNVRLSINGNDIQTFKTAQQLADLNAYYGRVDDAGYFTWWFVTPEFSEIVQRHFTALATGGLSTLSVHVDVDSGAVSPEIEASAVLSAPKEFRFLKVVKQFPVNSSVADEIEITDLLKRTDMRVMAMHLFKDDISNMEIEMDNVKIYDADKALGEAEQKQIGRTPQTAKATHIDFLPENDISGALSNGAASDFRIRPKLDTAGLINVVVEYIRDFKPQRQAA